MRLQRNFIEATHYLLRFVRISIIVSNPFLNITYVCKYSFCERCDYITHVLYNWVLIKQIIAQ